MPSPSHADLVDSMEERGPSLLLDGMLLVTT